MQRFSALVGFTVVVLANAIVSTAAHAGACPPEPGQGNLCTAKDFTVTSAIIEGPSECTIGETIAVRVRVGLTSTANQRYDIGIFTGEGGEPVFGGASCSLDSLVPLEPPFDGDSGFGGYRNLDGDACGDMSEPDGEIFKDVYLDQVVCEDNDGDGNVDISGLVTWSSNASQDVCTNPTDPTQFFPNSSSKCILDPDFNLPIIVEPPPSMRVFKLALPGNLPAPGGPILFVVDINNNSVGTDILTINSMIDNVHGDITAIQGDITRTDCSVPQVLVSGQSYVCEFTASVTGPAGYVEQDTVTVTGVDDEGEPVTAMDTAEVVIGDAPAGILVGKSANPTVVTEPGGEVVYSVLVANESDTEDVVIDTLDDDLYGSLSGKGTCPVLPFTLAPAEIMRCVFTETVTGDFGDPPVVDIITADGPGIDPKSDDAQVAIADVAGAIEVTKTALPISLPEPGGTFNFVLRVQNTSPVDGITINNIFDNVYGDLNGQGTCATGVALAPGETYSCNFDGDFFGEPGQFEVNLITVRAEDDDGGQEFDYDAAVVFITDIPASLAVTKTPNVTEQVAGGDVTYTVQTYNSSAVDTVTLNSMQDFPYGDITQVAGSISATSCSVPQVLPPGASYQCSFTATVNGALGDLVKDTVSVAGIDDAFKIVVASDSAVVEIVDSGEPPVSPRIIVTKVANPTAVSITDVPVNVGYLVRVFNPGATAVRITDATDDIYDIRGNDPSKVPIAPILSCPIPFELGPGESRACVFTGPVDGNVGDVVTDIVMVEACELPACTEFATASDDASVTITPNPVSLAVLKTANPTTVLSPGGPVVFSVEVANTSAETALTLTTLSDDIYGDITVVAGDISSTSCTVPQALAAGGGLYTCEFTALVSGVAGTEVIDIVTATAEDAGGLAVSDSDTAKVEILGTLPRVEVLKSADPRVVSAPGGTVTFTTRVINTSATEALTLTRLIDDIYGDLNGQGSCSVPQVIPATGIYRCSFPGDVASDSAALHRDTVSMEGTDESGDPVADSDWAVVLILPFGIGGGDPIPVPVNPLWLIIAGSIGGIGFGLLALSRRSRAKRQSS